jgi:hypothetical protein
MANMPELVWSEEGQSRLGDHAHCAGNRWPWLAPPARQMARGGVNKAVEAPDQQAALHRSCSAVRAFLRPCGNKTDGGYPLTDERGCLCDHAIPM